MSDREKQKQNTNTKTDRVHFRVTHGLDRCTSGWKTNDLRTDYVEYYNGN